jgi:hypothetical protein
VTVPVRPVRVDLTARTTQCAYCIEGHGKSAVKAERPKRSWPRPSVAPALRAGGSFAHAGWRSSSPGQTTHTERRRSADVVAQEGCGDVGQRVGPFWSPSAASTTATPKTTGAAASAFPSSRP